MDIYSSRGEALHPSPLQGIELNGNVSSRHPILNRGEALKAVTRQGFAKELKVVYETPYYGTQRGVKTDQQSTQTLQRALMSVQDGQFATSSFESHIKGK